MSFFELASLALLMFLLSQRFTEPLLCEADPSDSACWLPELPDLPSLEQRYTEIHRLHRGSAFQLLSGRAGALMLPARFAQKFALSRASGVDRAIRGD